MRSVPGNYEEFRAAARRRLPVPIFHYADGGADDERSMARNVSAFAQLTFAPRALTDVSTLSLTSSLLGRETTMPLMLAPTGMSRLFHRDKELGAARAAANAGIAYGLSTLATTSLEDVSAVSRGARYFQIYVFKDRGLTLELVERCRASGYDALCLTIDTPMAGNRERDRHTGMTLPPRLGVTGLAGFLSRPRWAIDLIANRDFRLANVAHRSEAMSKSAMGLLNYVNRQFDRSVTWDDAAWLVSEWGGPFVIKGVGSVADAVRAKSIGASAIMLSNHGGRQLDDVAAPIELVRASREAVGSEIELIVDGGVRRGSDIVKALCLGADACSVGRAYVYALAAAGEPGVARMVAILREDIERTMTLLGCSDVRKLDRSFLQTPSFDV
jgi:L-lactate dehydrogenase (cytochrome)